jgi:hypothetical protein
MGKRSAVLLVFGLLLLGIAFFTARRSADYDAYLNYLDRVQMENNGFFIAHVERREMNRWDYAAAGSVVLGASLVLAAVWLRRR